MRLTILHILASMLVSFLAVELISPLTRRVAVKCGVLDNPQSRKLQRAPVPLLGGVAVFFGIVFGACVSRAFCGSGMLYPLMLGAIVCLYLGTLNDILGLSPYTRFLMEILVVVAMMSVKDYAINDFHGLWGVHRIPDWAAWLLTILTVVGIINAINLLDGVDGLSSGFCMMASLMFCYVFFRSGDYSWSAFSAATSGALFPFFLHNVFGKKSKIFLGDGGTLVAGLLIASFIIRTLQTNSPVENYFHQDRISFVAFSLASLAVPIFDTLRVMGARIVRGHSPFDADKTHLHHLFIEMGFSHIGTTLRILLLNTLVVLCWWISFLCGASLEVQLYVVVGVALLISWVFYAFMMWHIRHDTPYIRHVRRIAYATHIERKGIWFILQRIVDKFYE